MYTYIYICIHIYMYISLSWGAAAPQTSRDPEGCRPLDARSLGDSAPQHPFNYSSTHKKLPYMCMGVSRLFPSPKGPQVVPGGPGGGAPRVAGVSGAADPPGKAHIYIPIDML